jgi:pyruvate/2-oxoglutarate dehydrogenase complex dihydrolipoamide acyltransferase (E2) component
VASIAWGKFQRLIAVELALNPNDRMDSLDFLKICRAELDRLIEQSPPIPKDIIHRFEGKFGTIKDLKRPDVCGALEHTAVFQSSETRLKNMAADAALMLRRKRQTLNELVSPQIEKKIAEQVETRLEEALEERKRKLEAEIESKKEEARKTQEDYDRALEDRKKKIQEEIELEKKKLYQEPTHQAQVIAAAAAKVGGSQFESRLNYRRESTSHIRQDSSRKLMNSRNSSPPPKSIYSFNNADGKNTIVTPSEKGPVISPDGDNIIIISKD